jgi:hypothetical protein
MAARRSERPSWFFSTPRNRTRLLPLATSQAMDRSARRNGLTELPEGWNPLEHPELIAMVKELAVALMADDERLIEDAVPNHAATMGAESPP